MISPSVDKDLSLGVLILILFAIHGHGGQITGFIGYHFPGVLMSFVSISSFT